MLQWLGEKLGFLALARCLGAIACVLLACGRASALTPSAASSPPPSLEDVEPPAPACAEEHAEDLPMCTSSRHCKTVTERQPAEIIVGPRVWIDHRPYHSPRLEVMSGEVLCFQFGWGSDETGYLELVLVEETNAVDLMLVMEREPEGRFSHLRFVHYLYEPLFGRGLAITEDGQPHSLFGERNVEFLLAPKRSLYRAFIGAPPRVQIEGLRTRIPTEPVRGYSQGLPAGPSLFDQPSRTTFTLAFPSYGYAIQDKEMLAEALIAAGYAPFRSYFRHLGVMIGFSHRRWRGSMTASLAAAKAPDLRDEGRQIYATDTRLSLEAGWEAYRAHGGILYPYAGIGRAAFTLGSQEDLPALSTARNFPTRDATVSSWGLYVEGGLGYEQLLTQDALDPWRRIGLIIGGRAGYQHQWLGGPWSEYLGNDKRARFQGAQALDQSGWMVTFHLGLGMRSVD